MTIYGKNPVIEHLRSGKKVSKILVTKQTQNLIEPFHKIIGEIKVVDNNYLNEKYGTKHQGMVAQINEYHYTNLDEIFEKTNTQENVTLIILDSLVDPHNLGAILRSADATGSDGIIIPKNRSVHLSDSVAKVSTGAINYVPVCEVTNLTSTINKLKDKGYWVVGLELGGTVDYRNVDYKGKIAIVIGSEGKGISRLVKESCDILAYIPMYGKVNSLNASVSCALVLYQVLTSRGK